MQVLVISWRERCAKVWLWTAVTESVSVFAIRTSRGRDVVDEMIGDDSTAIVGSDRFSVYGHLPSLHRQVCWAHLQRTFEDFLAQDGEAATVGQQLLACSEKLFT